MITDISLKVEGEILSATEMIPASDFSPAGYAYIDDLPVLHIHHLHHSVHKPVALKEVTEQLHAALPETKVWRYDGIIPVFEVNKGSHIQVIWKNEIVNSLFRRTITPFATGSTKLDIDINSPGRQPSFTDRTKNTVNEYGYGNRIRTVTHLHGALVASDSDGWTDNMILHNQSQHCLYTNNQEATMLWFHDHAMGVTRLNVYAGLLGIWIIRDDNEKGLNLPKDDRELILILQDKNLDTVTDEEGDYFLTGDTLHKVSEKSEDQGIMEFFGPFNMVNGKIWPMHKVRKNQYRLRLLNAANARSYKLAWLDEDNKTIEGLKIFKIGTDQGLLDTAIEIHTDILEEGISLMPGERMDVIVDFSGVASTDSSPLEIYLKNIACAPWNGRDLLSIEQLNLYKQCDIQGIPRDEEIVADCNNPFPEIMKFIVTGDDDGASYNVISDGTVLSNFKQIKDHDELYHDHQHRYFLLTEEEDPANKSTKLFMHELLENSGAMAGMKTVCTITENGKTKNYYSAAHSFTDAVNISDILLTTKETGYKATELWKIINNTGDAHPFHIHLGQSQVYRRHKVPVSEEVVDGESTGTLIIDLSRVNGSVVEPRDFGMKDTIMVNGKEDATDTAAAQIEILVLAIAFKEYQGRYMYHCHILEHEDHEMMRPIVVSAEPMKMDMSGMKM